MTEYTLYHVATNEHKDITEAEALEITQSAPIHTGPYGGQRDSIDMVLLSQPDDDYDNEHIAIEAIHLDGQWYTVPSDQSPYISHEIYG